ncbi:MAG TPA: fibronectin type III domain-containing protein [Verrucomicrobiae bacterium]
MLKYILALAAGVGSLAAAPRVTLAWDPSPSPMVAGYRVYYGPSSRAYDRVVDAGNLTSATVSNLVPELTYYFAATAYDVAGLESDYSTEISYTVPSRPPQLLITGRFTNAPIFTAIGAANSTYSILTSINLRHWTLLTNVTTDADGFIQFKVPPRGNLRQRFFRLMPTSS